MGRSRGGLTTKIHAVVDANGLPITLKLTPGQAHDGRSADDMLDTVGRRQTLIADTAYDSDRLRDELERRGANCCIKPIANETGPTALGERSMPTQPRRALLQQAQALPRHRKPLREMRRQLSGAGQTCFRQNLDAVYESMT